MPILFLVPYTAEVDVGSEVESDQAFYTPQEIDRVGLPRDNQVLAVVLPAFPEASVEPRTHICSVWVVLYLLSP